ncbi:MAG TPA: hypothetical protein VMS17_14765 [Gemmataceae bacterium]|nr:hypothetical protein [Gemmataceae bacterium]
MKSFFDCFTAHSAGADADGIFAELVDQSPLQLWSPGDSIPRHSVRLLIGVAPSSGRDMRLLDVIVEAMGRGPSALPTVDLFNTAHCRQLEDYWRYIPALRESPDTPASGIWFGGQLTWYAHGDAARKQIARMFGSTSEQIVDYVHTWIQNQPCSEGAKR